MDAAERDIGEAELKNRCYAILRKIQSTIAKGILD